jgi:hypothetical protein
LVVSTTVVAAVTGSESDGEGHTAPTTPVKTKQTKKPDDDDTTCVNEDIHNTSVSHFERHPKDRNFYLYHFVETSSTQDEAKIIAEELAGKAAATASSSTQNLPSFVVTATSQTNGRGTSGRQWLGAPGNVFVTIGIPQSAWFQLRKSKHGRGSAVPLTLLPLKVGSEVAKLIFDKFNSDFCQKQSSSSSLTPPRVTVKWPNDGKYGAATPLRVCELPSKASSFVCSVASSFCACCSFGR